MPKVWTPEERKAFGDKMRALKAEKAAKPVKQPKIEEKETIDSDVDIRDLIRQIEELKAMQWNSMVNQVKNEAQGTASIAGGKLTGTFEKYTLTSDSYPSPVDRLKEEPKLARFAFPINYELNYDVGISEYTTIDGIRTKEPKFTLELIRVIMDEDTGEPTNGRYIICRLIMHEDPEAALVIARDNQLDVPESDEATFLNEMRFIRMRDWLLECFYPAPVKKEHNKKEVVIDGKLVTYFEVTSEDSQVIDFKKLPKVKF